MVTVSDGFVRRMVDVYDAEGAAWIERLPAIVAECEQRWLLQACPSFEPLSYNYVAPVVLADGAAAVLKVGFPGPELLLEIEALRTDDGRRLRTVDRVGRRPRARCSWNGSRPARRSPRWKTT